MSASIRSPRAAPRTEADEERALSDLFATVLLPSHRVAQIESILLSSLDRPRPRSLAAEWIDLLRLRPLSTSALALVGAAAIVLLSPASGILFEMLAR